MGGTLVKFASSRRDLLLVTSVSLFLVGFSSYYLNIAETN